MSYGVFTLFLGRFCIGNESVVYRCRCRMVYVLYGVDVVVVVISSI